MTALLFRHALLPGGWADDVRLDIAADGTLAAVTPGAGGAAGATPCAGIAVPGLPNLHSHAFQRGMAGLAEIRGPSHDTFWTWRRTMYHFLDRLDPDDVEAIAAQLYVEMLERGFTAVAEFHYLHHAPDGRPYDDPAEMAGRIVAAAAATGIGLTLLPVLYAHGDFGPAPVRDQQRRFHNDAAGFLALRDAAGAHLAAVPDARLGTAPHSLRGAGPETLAEVLAATPDGPIHIHAAEQIKEVADCVAWSGARPVRWLLDNAAVDGRWCVIHATHMEPAETEGLARSGAVAGLCPITEANLGDGIFDGARFLAADGRFGIGSDSHVRIDAAEELRQLEYSQRLRDRARNVLAIPGSAPGDSTGRLLFDRACAGGGAACDRRIGALAPGYRADIVVLDPEHPALLGKRGDGWLDGWIFAGDGGCVRDVRVHGRPVVANGRHPRRDAVRARFAATLARLAD